MDNSAVKEQSFTPFQKKMNALKTYFSQPANIILVIFTIILTITVICPLVYLLLNTFLVHRGESFLGKVNTLTLQHWTDVLFTQKHNYAVSVFWKPLGNSVLMSIVSCLIAVIIG